MLLTSSLLVSRVSYSLADNERCIFDVSLGVAHPGPSLLAGIKGSGNPHFRPTNTSLLTSSAVYLLPTILAMNPEFPVRPTAALSYLLVADQ